MKLLVIGSGGREHALAWKLAQSPKVQTVFVAPGNAGTAQEPKLQNLPLKTHQELIDFCRREQIAFTVVGPKTGFCHRIICQRQGHFRSNDTITSMRNIGKWSAMNNGWRFF